MGIKKIVDTIYKIKETDDLIIDLQNERIEHLKDREFLKNALKKNDKLKARIAELEDKNSSIPDLADMIQKLKMEIKQLDLKIKKYESFKYALFELLKPLEK